MSYSGDALRSFNVQPTLCRDVRKRLVSLRIWSPQYKHVNSDGKQSFDHSVTVRKSLLGVKLGVMNCQSIGGKLDFVFDHNINYITLLINQSNSSFFILCNINWTLWL